MHWNNTENTDKYNSIVEFLSVKTEMKSPLISMEEA